VRATATLAVLLSAALVLSACTAVPGAAGGATGSSVAPPDAISALPVEQVSTATAPRLADGVTPPTSRWYASLAFSADPTPVYPYPIAFAPRTDGFTVQRPAVSVTPTSIAAPFTGGLSLPLGASEYRVVRGDAVSVTLAYIAGDSARARVTLAEGSPIVAVVAETDLDLPLPGEPQSVEGGAWTVDVDGVVYLLDAPDARLDGARLIVPQGAALQVAPLPDDADPRAWAAALGAPVDGATVAHDSGADEVTTRIEYTGTDATVVVPFAGREIGGGDAACELGTYDTPYGAAPACATTALAWSVPRIDPAAEYDLSALDDAARQELAQQASADLTGTRELASDTYFGGKGLARLASLLALARALGDDDLAGAAADRLATELLPWASTEGCEAQNTRCFVYDDRLHLVVGKTPGFGSEDGNDHHFHYGYFLYAAGVLGTERPDLVDTLRPVMTALAADIAAGSGDDIAPLRVFDAYRGHAWAAGLSPFADGNNQESSSEAVAAWNGLALWAEAAGDDALHDTAVWLLSSEAAAARELWLEPEQLPPGYAHTIVSISWSDKRDYATWFSAEPSAILGIQAVPLGPVTLDYLGGDPERVAENVADAGDTAFTGALGDYVQGYSALAGAAAADAAASAFAERTEFDDGWSKALALAWVEAVRLRE